MKDNYSPPPPSLPAGARAWAYMRDSGGPQQEQSIAQQESEIVAYCKRHNLTLVKVFRDVAKSGGSAIGRDEFIEMMEQSEDEAIRPDALLLWNFARFARDYNDFVFFKSTLQRRGIVVHSLTDSIPTDDFAGRIVETVISLANEEKRRQTSRDVKRSLKSLVSKGYAPGTPPRGYLAISVTIGVKRDGTPRIVSRWEPDPELSEYVKLAWKLRAEGKSYREITKATKGKLYTSSGSWVSFFKNKSYLGYYGKDEIPDHHEPLINQETWDAVQCLRESHPKHGSKGLHNPRRVGNPTLLSGFTYCPECGAMMTHSPGRKNKPWRSYLCGKKNRHGYKSCNSRRVGADKADAQITKTLMENILTPGFFEEAIAAAKQKLDTTVDIERELIAERRKLEELEIAIRRLLRTIEKTGSESAQDLLTQRENEMRGIRATIAHLNLQLEQSQIEITPEAIPYIVEGWRDQFNRLQETGTIREIKDFMMLFIKRIELGYNQAKIYYTYPVTDASKLRFIENECGGTSQEDMP